MTWNSVLFTVHILNISKTSMTTIAPFRLMIGVLKRYHKCPSSISGITMQLELLLLIFLRSIHQTTFSLYVDSIAKMLPWFFALNHHKEMLVLDTKDIVCPEALKTLCEIEVVGKQQSDTFVKECLVERTKSLYDPIKKNLFSTPAPKQSKASQQVSSLKNNCALFARLYISCKSRETASSQEKAPLKYMVKLLPRIVKMYGAQAPEKQPACLPVHMKRLTRECYFTRLMLYSKVIGRFFCGR